MLDDRCRGCRTVFWELRESGDASGGDEKAKHNETNFLPSKLRNPVIVFALFFTRCGFASFPMYCKKKNNQRC